MRLGRSDTPVGARLSGRLWDLSCGKRGDESPGIEDNAPVRASTLPSKMPTPSESPVTANELEQLAALHERGALSDEEFQAAKARLLGL